MINIFGITKSFIALLIAFSITFGLIASSNADTIGAGIGILDLPDPNIQVDTSTDGTNDQSRQNLDQSFTATLDAGEYVRRQVGPFERGKREVSFLTLLLQLAQTATKSWR